MGALLLGAVKDLNLINLDLFVQGTITMSSTGLVFWVRGDLHEYAQVSSNLFDK